MRFHINSYKILPQNIQIHVYKNSEIQIIIINEMNVLLTNFQSSIWNWKIELFENIVER